MRGRVGGGEGRGGAPSLLPLLRRHAMARMAALTALRVAGRAARAPGRGRGCGRARGLGLGRGRGRPVAAGAGGVGDGPRTASDAINEGADAYAAGEFAAAAKLFEAALALPGGGVTRDRAKGAELTPAEEFCAWFNLAEALASAGDESAGACATGRARSRVRARAHARPRLHARTHKRARTRARALAHVPTSAHTLRHAAR